MLDEPGDDLVRELADFVLPLLPPYSGTTLPSVTTGTAMPLFKFTRHGGQARGSQPHSPLPWIALIALILGAVALGFAWLAGWIGRDRLTAQNFTDAIEATGAKLRERMAWLQTPKSEAA